MSLWAECKLEREGVMTIEHPWGFITYLMGKEECYIQDLYVTPDQRNMLRASGMADEVAVIAKEHGCKILTGTVDINARGNTESLKVLLGYGMKLSHIKGNMIVFYKDLEA